MVSRWSSVKRAMPIEPVIALYVTALLLQLPIYQHYLYYRAKNKLKLNGTGDEDADNCNKNVSAVTNEIQREASIYILAYITAGTFPAMFASLFYGPLSDRKGRRLTMALPVLGSIVDTVLTLFTINFDLPVYVMVIGAAVGGFGGLFPTFVFTATAYIADTTKNVSKLPVRFATLEALALIGGVVAQATSGLWIKHLGYSAPYWFILGCHIVAFLYIVILLPESWKTNSENYGSCLTNCYTDFKSLIGVVIAKRENNGRLQLNLLLLITVLLLLPVGVINQLVILFAKDQPLCWDADLVGYYLASLFFARAIGAVSFMTLFKSCLNLQGFTIMQIGSIVLIGLFVMIGLSTNTLILFLTTIPGLFIGLAQPCIKSLMSSIVKPSEQGSLFCITASMESLCNFVSGIVFNPLYRQSISFSWPHANGLVFFINGGVVAIGVIVISCLKNNQNKQAKYYEVIDENNCQKPAVKA